MTWEILYLLIFAGLVWLLDRDIDSYPPSLPRSNNPRQAIGILFLLWVLALGVNAVRLIIINPWYAAQAIPPALQELINLPLITLPFLGVPLYLSLKIDGCVPADLGLTCKSRSTAVTIFALSFGVISGAMAFWTGETVVGVEALSAGVLLLLFYNNASLEEFYYRAIIQNRLERVFGQRRAVFSAGLIFATVHVFLDYQALAGEGSVAVLVAFLLQTLGGMLLGLIFIKTRALWPGVLCHYLVNWLPSILKLLTG